MSEGGGRGAEVGLPTLFFYRKSIITPGNHVTWWTDFRLCEMAVVVLITVIWATDSGIGRIMSAFRRFPLKIRGIIVLKINQFVQFPIVKKQDFFGLFLIPYRQESSKFRPAVSTAGTPVDMKAAGINAGGDLSLFFHRNQVIPVVIRIFMGRIVVHRHIRQGIKLFVQNVHFTLTEITPVIMKNGAHFPKNSHITQTSLLLLSVRLPSYLLLKFR